MKKKRRRAKWSKAKVKAWKARKRARRVEVQFSMILKREGKITIYRAGFAQGLPFLPTKGYCSREEQTLS